MPTEAEITVHIYTVPAFDDNYFWLLAEQGSAAIVDPGDESPVLKALSENNLDLRHIIITHHHADHVGGVNALLQRFPDACVFGPDDARIPGVTRVVCEGDLLDLEAPNLTLRVIEVPGHTSSHIAYYGGGKLFCGDTLFACGCGRLFEGTPEQMHASLSKIRVLPDETEVYCAHEYTLDNIGFALWVEPGNVALQQRQMDAKAMRVKDTPTVPSKLALEKKTNPFLRFDASDVITAAERFAGRRMKDSVDVLGTIRHWKDSCYD